MVNRTNVYCDTFHALFKVIFHFSSLILKYIFISPPKESRDNKRPLKTVFGSVVCLRYQSVLMDPDLAGYMRLWVCVWYVSSTRLFVTLHFVLNMQRSAYLK